MYTNAQLVELLTARGITAHDLDDVILALVHDQNAKLIVDMPAEASARIMQNIATEADKLTQAGLSAQIDWMDSYYNNRENLEWALAGFINLPLAA